MTLFAVTVETTGREVYNVEAATPALARSIFEDGDAAKPVVSEVTDATVVYVVAAGLDDKLDAAEGEGRR